LIPFFSYSQAAETWNLIPFAGSWIAGIWQFIVQVIGLRRMHEMSYFRIFFAFLIPLAFVLLATSAFVVSLLIAMGWTQMDRL
jgi:hypothetical protein